jgi:hypothetical protein
MNLILDLIYFIIDLVKRGLSFLFSLALQVWNKFLEIDIFEKLIVITTAGAFMASVIPVIRYAIYDGWRYLNNPIAVYLVGIVLVMLVTVYFNGLWVMALRAGLNAYYLAWLVYLWLSNGLGGALKAPYETTAGLFVHLLIPVVYMILSLLHFMRAGR